MRILKWLFHPINLFIIVILVAVYINRHTLFPELSESPEVKQITDRVDSVIDSMNASISTLGVPESKDESEVASLQTTSSVPQASADADSGAVVTSSDRQAVADDMPNAPVVIPPSPVQPESNSVQTDETANTASANDTATGAAPVHAPDISTDNQTGADPLVVWDAARRAAWEGKYDVAVGKYRELIGLQPGNFDAYGEMGNVLLRQGDMEAAVDAYYQAAMLLSQSRYPQVAWRVLDIVARLDQKKGQQLYEAMRQQQLGASHP